MDLNEKIAARRRELASQAENAMQVEAAKQKVAAIEAAKLNKIEKETIDAEVAKRLTPIAVTLLAVGEKRIEVVKVIQAATGSSPVDCMNIVDHTPSLVMQGMSAIDAEMLKNKLADAGAIVEMKT